MPLADDWLQPFTSLITGIADLDAALIDDDLGIAWHMERAELSTPIELDIRVDDGGTVTIASAPPTQHVETTYMPVFHQCRLTLGPDGDG